MINSIVSMVAFIVFFFIMTYAGLCLEHIRQITLELGKVIGPLPLGACIFGYFTLLDFFIHDRAFLELL